MIMAGSWFRVVRPEDSDPGPSLYIVKVNDIFLHRVAAPDGGRQGEQTADGSRLHLEWLKRK